MSGDVERDAEHFDDDTRYPPHLRRPPEKVLSANQLIAFNMWRSRKSSGWSQQEVAELLEKYTGRPWSNASVSAAERSWQGGRPRKFDANEVLALSKIFDEPIAYFFLPPEDSRWNTKYVGMREFPDEHPNMDPEAEDSDLMGLIETADYVGSLGLYKITPGLEFRMQELALRHLGLSWVPPKWKMPFEHTPLRPNGAVDWTRLDEEAGPSITADQLDKLLRENAEKVAMDVAVQLDRMGYLRKDPASQKGAGRMSSSQIIRNARIYAKMSLGDVAKETGISVYKLSAVEDGDWSRLEWDHKELDPDVRLQQAVEIIGEFAQVVGLDPKSMVDRYMEERDQRQVQ